MASTLRTRALTAVVFVAVMVAGIFLHSYSFILLMALIIMGSVWEFQDMTCESNFLRTVFSFLAIGSFVALIAGINLPIGQNISWFNIFFCIVFSIMLLCLGELFGNSSNPFRNIVFSTFSISYYPIFLSSIFFISFDGSKHLVWVIFALISLTWVNDTMAYLIGSKVGKNKMAPSISPNKTWEGTIGGILSTVLVAFIFYHFTQYYSPLVWLGLAIIIGVFGTLGDLVESLLKRNFKVKDTGTLLPGHGGLLDRFDSLTFHMPLSVYFIHFCSAI